MPVIRRAFRRLQSGHSAKPALTLQFPLGHPIVSSVIPGARSAEELQQNLAYLLEDIPPGLWADLKDTRLIEINAPVPGA
ncbi:hypothetical protein EOD08_30235 [Mesorhizobium sp. M6A.T.Ca.TU.002.02.2.1]|nr:hypothetical protein EOD08_30235 [Mesorhizobium sp. M6A.T.Ca.TU.002.02.2.1]